MTLLASVDVLVILFKELKDFLRKSRGRVHGSGKMADRRSTVQAAPAAQHL